MCASLREPIGLYHCLRDPALRLRWLPHKARYKSASILAVLLAGLLILSIPGYGTSAAADEPAAGRAPEGEGARETPAVLTGRITDDKGAPVADAEVTLHNQQVRANLKSKTDADGRYRIASVPVDGEYRVQIDSQRCVGLTFWTELPVLNLTADSRMERDFTLPRACRLKIRTVDEQGQPVALASVLPASLAENGHRVAPSIQTDKAGVAIVGGLAPSDAGYVVGIMHEDYGFEKLVVPLHEPDQVVSQTIVLRAGKTMTGTAVCSDGKPPVGWRILALPNWWHFGRYPIGTTIAADGSFSLPHIVDGRYDVTISIPQGQNGSSPRHVLTDTDLLASKEPLSVRLDYPSPASLVSIAGRIKVLEGTLTDGFWIHAYPIDGDLTRSSSVYVLSTDTAFTIGPVVRGEYRLKIDSVGVESKPLVVKAPANDVVVELSAHGQPMLHGVVVRDDTQQPLSEFRIRVLKRATLRGPNFVQNSTWREFRSETGEFDLPITGPGVYEVMATAPGFAWVRSESINTDEEPDKRIRIPLVAGIALPGRVVDEEGIPIDGATVLPLSKSTVGYALAQGQEFDPEDSATTVAGEFVLKHLLPGEETLRVTHPDFCFAVVPHVVIGKERGAEPLSITLTRGGTVRGHVYDAQGQPEPNVTLYFQDGNGYGSSELEKAGRVAIAVTDADGSFEARHLPEKLCYVHRAEDWNSFGVARHCILPENGRVQTLDFGSGARLQGRLLINGEPLVNGRLELTGGNPNFGIFRAYARTADDGSFAFLGLPPGDRVLYYAIPGRLGEWGRVADVRLSFQDVDLGVVDHLEGQVIIQFDPPQAGDAAGIQVYFTNYDPVRTAGNSVGVIDPTQHEFGRFVIEHVPVGTYEALCFSDGRPQVREPVEVTREFLSQTLTVRIPSGTASLTGQIAPEFRGAERRRRFRLWSDDRRLLAFIAANAEGTYKLEQLPAGRYMIRETDLRDTPVLLEFSLSEGEHKVLDLTPENITQPPPAPPPRGFVAISVFTTDGMPLPCHLSVAGPQGDVTPHTSDDGRASFAAEPGEYTLHVRHPGFKPVERAVLLRDLKAEGITAAESEVRVILEEDR